MKLLWIALAGALGTLTRYWMGGAVQRLAGGSFPVGTFAINVSGCFVFGLFWAVAIPFWASWRMIDLFKLADHPGRWWMWIVLAVFCLWSFWLTLQLFLRRGTEGPNGYDGRDFYKNMEIS